MVKQSKKKDANASIFFKMAVQMGLEPTISSVTGRHVNHYTTGPK